MLPQAGESLILLRRDNTKLRKQVAKLEATLKRRNEQLRLLEDLVTEMQLDKAKLARVKRAPPAIPRAARFRR